MKHWTMPCRAPKTDWSWWRVLTKCGPVEKGMANHFSILALRTPWIVWKGKKDMTLKDELPRLVGAQYVTEEEQRNSSRRNEEAESKQKWCTVVIASVDETKVQCCKDCIGTWNVRSMNHGKLEMVKQEMARVNRHFRNQLTKMDQMRSI